MIVHYRCPTCGATKEIHGRPGDPYPDAVVCGWRGCEDRAVPPRVPPRFSPRDTPQELSQERTDDHRGTQ